MASSKPSLLLIAFILSLLFVYLILFGGLGIAATIYIFIYYAVLLGYAKVSKMRFKRTNLIFLIPIFLTALCFTLYSNLMLRFINFLLLTALVLLQMADMFDASVYPLFSLSTSLELMHLTIIMPLCNLGASFRVIKKFSPSKGKFKTLPRVLLGVLIAIPFMIIVTKLLISSDTAFAQVMQLISSVITTDLQIHVFKFCIAVILTLFLFALLDGLGSHLNFLPEDLSLQIQPIIDPVISLTVSTLIGVIYIIYCFSQLAYFISAFKMILPETFTFAEYTRKGFFELVPLSLMNIFLIYVLVKLTQATESKLQLRWKQVNCLFITFFNLFLIASTLFKMAMYVSSYGLTPRRFYTTWFMILLGVLFLIILIKLLIPKVKAQKCFYISFIVLFLGLNFINPDRLIASYNIKQYTSGAIKELDFDLFYHLSDAAVPEVLKLLELNDPKISSEINQFLNKYQTDYNPLKWQTFNFSSYKAQTIIDAYKK